MNFDNVKNDLINEANIAGLEEYEIFFMEGDGVSAETLKHEVSAFSSEVGGGVCFRCVVDGHMGSASTEIFTKEEMKRLVARACENAKNIESADKAIIFEGSKSYAKLELPKFEAKSTAEIKQIVLDLEKKIYDSNDLVVDGSQAYAYQSKTKLALINSKGLNLSAEVGSSGAYAQAVVQKDGESQEAFCAESSFDAEKLNGLAEKAVNEAIAKLGATSVESGKYDMIFSGKQMRSLLSAFSSVFSGRSALLGLSLLKGKEGEQIASDCVTLIDNPMRKGYPMQTAFDGEGVATYEKNVIEDGRLNTFLYDLATADRLGIESTGNGQRSSYADTVSIRPYSFYFKAGELTKDELLSKVENGIYITALNGLHAGANSSTGDFSIDSAGFRIRNGKLCEAVKSFTVAGNFFEILKSIEAFSDEIDFGMPSGFTVYGSPDVLVRKISVAGK